MIMNVLKSGAFVLTRQQGVYLSMMKRRYLLRRNLTFLLSLHRILIMYLPKKNFSKRFGGWNQSETLLLLQFILRRLGKKLKKIHPNHSISRQYGELDTDLRYHKGVLMCSLLQIITSLLSAEEYIYE